MTHVASTAATTATTTATTLETTMTAFNTIEFTDKQRSSFMHTAAPMLASELVRTLLDVQVDEQTGEKSYDSDDAQTCALLGTLAATVARSILINFQLGNPWTGDDLDEKCPAMLETIVKNNDWVNLDVTGKLFDAIQYPAALISGMESVCHVVEENNWVVPSRAAYQWILRMGSITPMFEPVTPENRRSKSVSPRSKKEWTNSFSYIKGGAVKPNAKVKKALNFFESTPYLMDEEMYYIIEEVARKCPEHVQIKTMEYAIKACKDLLGKGQLFGEWYTDKRGRFYPIAFGGPNLQTSDLGRSLYSVVSHKGLTEEQFNKVGKRIFFQDLKDAWDNSTPLTPKIMQFVLNAPIEYIVGCLTNQVDSRLIANKPFMFVKMCLDYAQAKLAWSQGNEYIFNTPIGLDAKSSGTQILAILAGAHDVADRCGITAVQRLTDKERKAVDPYAFAGEMVDQELQAQGYNFTMTRGKIKTPYMAIQYGGGFRAIMKSNDFKSWVRQLELDAEGAKDFCGVIIDKINESLGKQIEGFINSVEHNVREKCVEMGVNNFRYFTFDGFPVQTADREVITTGTSFRICFNATRANDNITFGNMETGESWNVTGEETVEEFVRKFVVHFIQGTDAMLARTVAIKAQEAGIEGYASIHDCFRTSVADADKLLGVIQAAYVEIFSDNKIVKSLEKQIGELKGYVDAEGTWINFTVGEAIDSNLFTAETFYGFC